MEAFLKMSDDQLSAYCAALAKIVDGQEEGEAYEVHGVPTKTMTVADLMVELRE